MQNAGYPSNNLLGALKTEEFGLLKPHLQPWSADGGTIIYEPGDEVRFAYFPCGSSLLSFTVMMQDGRNVETALVGREGAAGGIVSNGYLPAFARTMVQAGGVFLRLEAHMLEEAKTKSDNIRNLFSRYADCLLAQVFQSVACNAVHTLEQRAARWMLAAVDRTGRNEVRLTQEELAAMLGVGRSYVNRILKALQSHGMIETHRGGLIVKNAEALERVACECSDAIRRHFEEVLSGVYPNGRKL